MWYKHIIHVQESGFPTGRIAEYWVVNKSEECDIDEYVFDTEMGFSLYNRVLIATKRSRKPSQTQNKFIRNCEPNIPIFIKYVNTLTDKLLKLKDTHIDVLGDRCDVLNTTIDALKERIELLKDTKYFDISETSQEDLKYIKIKAGNELFRLENNMTHEELEGWIDYKTNNKSFFWKSLATFLTEFRKSDVSLTSEHIKEVIETKTNKAEYVEVFDKKIPFFLFEKYWRFLRTAKVSYIGLDVFESKRSELHNALFIYLDLDRHDDDDKYVEEVLRLSCIIDNDEFSEFKQIDKLIEEINIVLIKP